MRDPIHRRAACWLATAIAGLGAAAAAQDRPLTAEELYEKVAPSVWMVQVVSDDKSGIGSAVVTAPRTLITNCHVVDKARMIAVRHGHRRFEARLQYRDPTRDLCQLSVPGLDAPPVPVADWRKLRIGTKLYAVGNPRGLELTLSDGLLSGIRRDSRDDVELQITVPISPGSSGGGLFDAHGRLVGITTSGLRESQNINFALPATWIAELPVRAGGAVAVGVAQPAPPAPAAPAVPPVAALPPPAAISSPAPTNPAGPNVFEYVLRDKVTGLKRTVIYRVDRRQGDLLVINGGTRVEDADGRVIALKTPVGGEFEQAMPPGGWVHGHNAGNAAWSETYTSLGDGRPYKMELKARNEGEEVRNINGRPLRTIRVRFTGYSTRDGGIHNNPAGYYVARAWYAPDLGRVVRFEARTRGGLGGTVFYVNEEIELVDARQE